MTRSKSNGTAYRKEPEMAPEVFQALNVVRFRGHHPAFTRQEILEALRPLDAQTRREIVAKMRRQAVGIGDHARNILRESEYGLQVAAAIEKDCELKVAK